MRAWAIDKTAISAGTFAASNVSSNFVFASGCEHVAVGRDAGLHPGFDLRCEQMRLATRSALYRPGFAARHAAMAGVVVDHLPPFSQAFGDIGSRQRADPAGTLCALQALRIV
jgi:hypothetical protein